ncbi:MAG TPA: T9SS type A sorting domain-containing protein, partial [Saprospiraceae bacterium]|nr:T9SS type A sorting domain-containing protein [Saprospiraceae bacterium]
YFGNSGNQYERSSMIVIDKTNGDSLDYVEFPGTMQFPTYTKQLLLHDPETFVALNQLRDVTEIVLYDHNLNEISSFSVPLTQAADIAITKDRIAIMCTAYGPGSVPTEMNTFSWRYFRLYTYDGQLVYEEELEHNQTYEVASHQDVIVMTIVDSPNEIWQVFQDSLIELLPSTNNLGTFDERLISWRDTSSIFLDFIFSTPVKGITVNLYNAENARFSKIDTLINSVTTRASGIFQDHLYLSTGLINHPTSAEVFFGYDINTRKKTWEHIDRAYNELYGSGPILYGLNNASPGVRVDGIDPNTGLVLWQQTIPVDFNKKKAKLDIEGNQLIIYDFVDEEFDKEFITLYQVSGTGKVNQPFRYSGAKPSENHLYDILPFTYHQELFYLTSGAFFHPNLRKTAFINLYSGNQLSTPIRLNAFFDKNENHIKDVNEISIGWGYFLVNSAAKIYLHNQDLNFYPAGSAQDTIQYVPLNGWYFTTDSVQFINPSDTGIVYFGISTIHEVDSITSVITTAGRWRCNRSLEISTQAINDGTSITDGVIKVVVPNAFTIINASSPIDHIDGDTLFFSFTEMYPGQYKTIILNVKVPGASFNNDTFELKEVVEFQGSFTSQTKLVTSTVQDIVRCGFDPNDKLVNPMRGENNPIVENEDIHYTIRFQNTGNDTTFRVEVLDTLSQYLDLSSLKVLSSSHPCDVALQDHILKAIFMPIQLPDSTTNYLASQGYIHFSIRPIQSLPENTVIKNRASIYFDFNAGITTNTTTSTLVDKIPVSVKELPQVIPSFEVSPNPSNSSIRITSMEESNKPMQINLFDVYGNTRLKTKILFGASIDIGILSPGVYFIAIEGYATQKLIVNSEALEFEI